MAKKTFENDDNLPALPLPSLKNTLDLYLQSVVPFLTKNELEKTSKMHTTLKPKVSIVM